MLKIMVTGSSGFIGSHLCDYLSKLGNEVVGIDVSNPIREANYTFVKINLRNNDIHHLVKEYRPQICIHCAGSASVAKSMEMFEEDFHLSVVTTFNLLAALRNFSPECKLVYLSSAAVYGNPISLPITETHPLSPISPYGYHKLHTENVCREFHDLYGIPVTILRIFSAYGVGLRKQLLWDLCIKASQGGTVTLFGDGYETRDFIYISDILDIVHLIIKKSPFIMNCYNIANGEQVQIKDIANIIVREFPQVNELIFNGMTRPGDPLNWQADIARIRQLGYSERVTIEEGVKKYVKWFKEIHSNFDWLTDA